MSPKINSGSVGWKDGFVNKYEDYGFYQDLLSVYDNETFAIIKAITNMAKHSYLLRIKNTRQEMLFDTFTYKFNQQEIKSNDMNVGALLVEAHDELIPELLGLLNRVIETPVT